MASTPSLSQPLQHSQSQGNLCASVITYRHRDKLAYVPNAKTYTVCLCKTWLAVNWGFYMIQEAVQYARQSFPELTNTDPESITFTLSVRIQGVRSAVSVGSLVWEQMSLSFVQYEILTVVISPPPPFISISKSIEIPPPYTEKGEFDSALLSHTSTSHSRAPSPSPSILKRVQGWLDHLWFL